MSDRRLFSYDAATKTRTWYEDTPTGFELYTEQDVSEIIEQNKSKHADPDALRTKDGDWIYAHIPNVFVLKFLDDYGVNVYGDGEHVKATMRLLNNPDYRFLKTTTLRA